MHEKREAARWALHPLQWVPFQETLAQPFRVHFESRTLSIDSPLSAGLEMYHEQNMKNDKSDVGDSRIRELNVSQSEMIRDPRGD